MNPNIQQHGFTLIEIMLVVGILAIIISLASVVDLNMIKGDTFHAERSTIVAALQKARSRAMANVSGVKHGLCLDTSNPAKPMYVIFEGNTCTVTGSDTLPANSTIVLNSGTTSPFPTVVFDQLSGRTTGHNIHIEDGVKSGNIEINDEGTINW